MKTISLSIKQKIIGAFFFIALLVAITGGASIFFFTKIDASYTQLLQRNSQILEHIGELKASTQLQNSLLFRYLVEPTKENEQQLWTANSNLTEQMKQMTALVATEAEAAEVAKLQETSETFRRLAAKVKDYMDRKETALAISEARLWSVPLTETLVHSAIVLEEQQKAVLAAQVSTNQQVVATTSKTFVAVGIGAVLIAVAIGILLSRMMIRPLRELSRTARDIAGGQLQLPDIPIRHRDEIGELSAAFNQMKANLRTMVSHVGDHSKLVSAAAYQMSVHSNEISGSLEQVSTIAQTISEGTGQQVSSVEKAALILYEMEASADQVTHAAREAELSSEHARQSAETGNAAIRSAVQQMSAIQLKMGALTSAVERLSGRSAQIHRANEAITDIAKKINMLALNASIEAARAGDAGKGFAVVASEVRKLSLQTTAAASEISSLISSIQAETEEVTQSTVTGVKEVAAGVQIVEQAGEAFRKIDQTTAAVAEQIIDAVAQARFMAGQVQSAVETIRIVKEVAHQSGLSTHEVCANVEEQYASMEEITASAEKLSAMTEELHGLLTKFRV